MMEYLMPVFGVFVLIIVAYLFNCMAVWGDRKEEAALYAQRYRQNFCIDPDELLRREIEHAGVDMGVGITKSTAIIQQQGHGYPRLVEIITIDGRDAWMERSGLHDEACNNFLMLMKEAINEDAVS